MKKLLIFIIIASTFKVHAQQEFNSDYYDNLLVELKANPTVADAKQISKTYNNGVQKLIYTVVKFKNDSIDRYWHVGKAQMNYKNGQQFVSMQCDSVGKFMGGEIQYYYKNGNVLMEYECFDYSDGHFIQKIKKGYIKKPFNKIVKRYDKNGRIKIEKTFDIARNKTHTGITKLYFYSKKATKVVEREYKMGKRISKRKYFLN